MSTGLKPGVTQMGPVARPLRALPVPARARRFQQGLFARLHSDECRPANSMKDCPPRLRLNKTLTRLDFLPLGRQTSGRMRTRNRHPYNPEVAFLRSPRAQLGFALSPYR